VLSAERLANADVNGDGVVDVAAAVALVRRLEHLPTRLRDRCTSVLTRFETTPRRSTAPGASDRASNCAICGTARRAAAAHSRREAAAESIDAIAPQRGTV